MKLASERPSIWQLFHQSTTLSGEEFLILEFLKG